MMQLVVLFLLLVTLSNGFLLQTRLINKSSLSMATITTGVEFTSKAREWRLKWSADDEKKSLASVQQTLSIFQKEIKSIKGVTNVQRLICGGCLDYKVIITLPNEAFDEWEAGGFTPESEFLAAVKAVAGVTAIETQTFAYQSIL
mmetsp:Transcript_21359/g.19430  ORF Transcript_21359/g.19430 Transcript_21359/m.19430 type:complete len:145 (+) Transcript_21359:64-498(+)